MYNYLQIHEINISKGNQLLNKNKKKQKGQNYEQRIKHYKYKKHTYLILLCPFFGCFQIILLKKEINRIILWLLHNDWDFVWCCSFSQT